MLITTSMNLNPKEYRYFRARVKELNTIKIVDSQALQKEGTL